MKLALGPKYGTLAPRTYRTLGKKEHWCLEPCLEPWKHSAYIRNTGAWGSWANKQLNMPWDIQNTGATASRLWCQVPMRTLYVSKIFTKQ